MTAVDDGVDLEQVAALLRHRHEQTIEQIRVQAAESHNLRQAARHEPGDVADAGSLISDTAQRDIVTAALTEQAERLSAALDRLQDGSFGICGKCGQQIPLARMEIMPWATHCIACQQRAERGR
ncbi:TraR/DksA family transcriptional regulator [Catellatospora sichuanensis]|uniref:TraR/DksA family transcriptional regulator n=1 Tax=Catellatospora sichuanensis TaxID=1969805 RepID=UPI0011842441|nr:TraR/DksA family transcriptional regulator [Catellatospora sichuanensis]